MWSQRKRNTQKRFFEEESKKIHRKRKMYTEKDEGDWGNDLTELDIQRHSWKRQRKGHSWRRPKRSRYTWGDTHKETHIVAWRKGEYQIWRNTFYEDKTIQ